jgi:kynureninase
MSERIHDTARPLADGAGYFLYHSIGMFAGKERLIAEGLRQFAHFWSRPDDAQWPQALALRQQFIEHWQALINAPSGTLTTAENVTTALHSLIGALPARHLEGRRVLIAADCFPSLHFLLAGMAQRYRFVLDTVPLRDGEHWVRDEDFIAHWTDDVGLALLTQATSTASYRCDLKKLIAHGRHAGSLIGVDITQAVGLLPFDARQPEVDFTVSTSLKWLSGTSGAGILHVRAELLRECSPDLRGWFSQENPFSWDLNAFQFAPDARRFDHGTPSVVACAGTLPCLAWYAAQDTDALLAHNRTLTEAIMAGADTLRLNVISPREEQRRGGSVMIKLPATADPPAIIAALRASGIYADCRGATLRLSPGNVTTRRGVEHLLDRLEHLLKG